MKDLVEKLAAEASRIEEDAEYSAKRHYNAADRWAGYHLWVGLPAAILAATAGSAAFADCPMLAGGLATLSAALTAVLTFLKPSERAESHKAVAGYYLTLRNRTRMFREIELADGCDIEKVREGLLGLANDRDELNQTSPNTRRKDYERAKADIDDGRSHYRIDRGDK